MEGYSKSVGLPFSEKMLLNGNQRFSMTGSNTECMRFGIRK